MNQHQETVDRLICDAQAILALSQKHGLHLLEHRCTALLWKYLSVKTVWKVYNLTWPSDNYVSRKCEEMIAQQAKMLLESSDFLEISPTTLARALKAIILPIRECEKFEICIKWARHYCKANNLDDHCINLREVLRACTSQIRFISFTSDEFDRVVISMPLFFTSAEIRDTYTAIESNMRRKLRAIGHHQVERRKVITAKRTAVQRSNVIHIPIPIFAENVKTTNRLNEIVHRYLASVEAAEKIPISYAELDSTDSWPTYSPTVYGQDKFDFYDHETFWAVCYYRLLEWITIVVIVFGIGYEIILRNIF